MNQLKVLIAISALATALIVPSASATTLEIGGVGQGQSVEITKILKQSSVVMKDTSNLFVNTCTEQHWVWHTSSPFIALLIGGTLTKYELKKCTHESVKVAKKGTISIEHIAGSTNGTMRSTGAEITVPTTIFGSVITATCTTNNTDIGTLTGVKSGRATMDFRAVTYCGSFLPSAVWEATYEVISPEGLGVTA